ncbi:MAG: EamA family transporter, partial [Mailhella sp.]|nr:EamA family transporter [Mailhella sp.]
QLNCTRFLVGGMLLVPFGLHALKKRGLSLDLPAWKGFAGLGFLGLVVSMMLYQVSILYVPASVVSVLFSCNPVLVLAFAFLILRTDIRPQHIIALVLEVVGALVIIDPLHTLLDMRGVALVLLSAATFALYAVLGKKLCSRYSGLAVTSFSCVAASVEMLLIMAVSHAAPVAEALRTAGLPFFAEIPFMQGYTSGNILTVLYICIFVTGGGYACYFMGMERTSPMQGSLVFFFKPILAPLLAMFILGESISWNMWCGIGLILAASLISMLPTIQTLNGIRHLHFPHRKK